MEIQELIEALRNANCEDGFVCIFGMYGRNDAGCFGCFAKYPDGDTDKPNQGCIAHQAANIIEKLSKTSCPCCGAKMDLNNETGQSSSPN